MLGPRNGTYLSATDVAGAVLLLAYEQHLRQDESWQHLPNLRRWVDGLLAILNERCTGLPPAPPGAADNHLRREEGLTKQALKMVPSRVDEAMNSRKTRNSRRRGMEAQWFDQLNAMRRPPTELENLAGIMQGERTHRDDSPDAPSRQDYLLARLDAVMRPDSAVPELDPACGEIILFDRNVFSLSRALQRAAQLKLTNVSVCIGDMESFAEMALPFDLGVGLHFCGMLTDLALNACISQHAAFVFCPCCYGKISRNFNKQGECVMDYPRSERYRDLGMDMHAFSGFGVAADQDPGMLEDGCTYNMTSPEAAVADAYMDTIDGDRLSLAETQGTMHGSQEAGYLVALGRLRPLECTPKHNIICGSFHKTQLV
ncbi:uncharacterized protein MONBRDRAFT_27083 [Monosiga brevicollis MX1]|uniref:Methyltransferase domain-containing protein n=1 Tax=Monosiga brevicollis TaxID=81824 RepID=A9V492_MONBE|nr:uncharacterized protein MONBRDRAFT_27083 [Monosiga brevicollis MX1]EDQ87666.1 predicted protein [Monosiga brevicollis MX1]|eukprot:XP_001747586.1 hypothetical protein [Monosiga brevicollis MX1]